jgi:hypothetical protein
VQCTSCSSCRCVQLTPSRRDSSFECGTAWGRAHPWRQALQLHAPRHKGGQQLAGPQEAAGADAVQQQVQLAELDAALVVCKACSVVSSQMVIAAKGPCHALMGW